MPGSVLLPRRERETGQSSGFPLGDMGWEPSMTGVCVVRMRDARPFSATSNYSACAVSRLYPGQFLAPIRLGVGHRAGGGVAGARPGVL